MDIATVKIIMESETIKLLRDIKIKLDELKLLSEKIIQEKINHENNTH